MKNVQRSFGFKIILILLEQISLLVTVIAILFMESSNLNISLDDVMKGTSYYNSSAFSQTFQSQIEDVVNYIKLYQNYTTKGEYDPQRVVDIKSYYETQRIDNDKIDSIGYYVGDLVKMYQYRQTESSNDRQNERTDAMSEAERQEQISSQFRPTNASSLTDYVEMNFPKEEQEEEREKLDKMLAKVSESVYQDVMEFKTIESQLDQGNTNLRYILLNSKQKVLFANVASDVNVEELKKLGKYITYDSANSDYSTNTGMTISKFNEVANQLAMYGDCTIALAVNKDMPVKDVFYHEYKNYNRMFIAYLAFVVGSFVFLISLLAITVVAGRTKDSEEVYLSSFDHLKSEIAAGLLLLIASGVSLIFLLDYNSSIQFVIWVAAEDIFFMIGYASLIRRIKAKQLWKNSLLYCIWRGWGNFFSYKKITFQVVVYFGIFIIASFIVNATLFSEAEYLGLLLCFLLYGGTLFYLLREGMEQQKVMDGINQIKDGDLEYKISVDELKGRNRILAEAINHIGEGLYHAVDASMKNERLKTDLITNVSHDIKTPLTSIINYVDLIKREHIDNEKIQGYIEILDSKSQRLKHLTEDLVEASKISSGNITLEIAKINFVELIHQTIGEFEEKFEEKGLQIIVNLPKEPVYIMADSRRIWRIVENLFQNVNKYAMPNTRVYIDLKRAGKMACLSIKNISECPLNIEAEELTERFIRGDVSRSTEGSGLGLSIAKNLTELQKGTFVVYLDGDLFRVTISFRIEETNEEERDLSV